MNEARIKLAETMGWRKGPKPSGNSVQGWYAPEGVNKAFTGEYGLPDPENDANDCEALIRHLIDTGWRVEIDFPSLDLTETAVRIYSEGLQDAWYGYAPDQNWKRGVCELALKLTQTVEDTGA